MYEHLAKPFEPTFATSESDTVVHLSKANETNHVLLKFMKLDVLPYLDDLPIILTMIASEYHNTHVLGDV